MFENLEIKDKSCRNCLNRFTCTEDVVCDEYAFDDEAATCDDCSKKEECPDYAEGKVTCTEWDPIVTCDECTKQETCKSFMEGGRICDDFEAIRYQLTEKGCLFLAMAEVMDKDEMYIEIENLLNSDFFEVLEHEIKLNGLFVERPEGIIAKVCQAVKNLFKKKPEKTLKDVFFEVAHNEKYFRDFGLSDNIVDAVYNRLVEKVQNLYQNR